MNYVSGHVILIQYGSICSRAKYHINSYNSQKYVLQRIILTPKVHMIPLLYPISMLFPSIGYKMTPSYGYIVGVLPSCLMITKTSTHKFASVEDHIRLILTNPGVATRTNQNISYCYETLTNLTLNHTDTCLILNKGLKVYSEGLGPHLCSKQDSTLGGSIDGKTMVQKIYLSKNIIL